MKRAPIAAVCLLAAACSGSMQLVERGATYAIEADREGAALPRADLRVCLQTNHPEYFSKWMSEVFTGISVEGSRCHVLLVGHHGAYDRKLEFKEAASGEPLFIVTARFTGVQAEVSKARISAALKRRFAAAGPLYARLAAAPAASTPPLSRTTSASPAPPAGASLSAADIERIASAVRGAEAPAAAARPLAAPRYSAAERPDDLAIVVGVETYSDIATKAPYAERDAEAFKAHTRALGVPERNIVLLTGSKAVRSALVKNVEGWLPRMAKPSSRVYFYFSGHGAPDVKSGQAYLVPWDGDPNFLEATAYPVAQLYKKLGELPAKQVLVAMDSCFSGAGGRSVLASGARPLVAKVDTGSVPTKLTVLAASASNEISGSLDDKGHGAFTWFLLEGLNAGKTTAKALHEYLTPKVQDEARRLNRDQTPQLLGADTVLR